MSLNRSPFPEYSLAVGWKIFILVMCPILIVPFGYLLYKAYFIPGQANKQPVLLLMGAGGTVFCIYAMIRTVREKLVLSHDRFIHILAFSQKELLYQDFKGYREHGRYINLIHHNGKTIIKIADAIGNKKDPLNRLPIIANLDAIEAYESHRKILTNTDYGYTEQEAYNKLAHAQRLCQVLNIVGVLICLWVVFYPRPYLAAVLIVMILPLVAILIVKMSKRLIKLDELKNSAKP